MTTTLGLPRKYRTGCAEIPPEQQDGLRNFELGCLALQLGGKHQIPLVNRQHSMRTLEPAYLRTFYSSAGMLGVIDLEFESVFDPLKFNCESYVSRDRRLTCVLMPVMIDP